MHTPVQNLAPMYVGCRWWRLTCMPLVRSRAVGGQAARAVGAVGCAVAALVWSTVATSGAVHATSDTVPAATDVLIDNIGEGWTPVEEESLGQGGLVRSFEHDQGARLDMNVVLVSSPPGVRETFQTLSGGRAGFEQIPEPSFDLAAWLVPEGQQPGEDGFAMLAFASHDHVFVALLSSANGVPSDPLGFVRDIATAQIDAAGGPPAQAGTTPSRSADDDELIAVLPQQAPGGFDLTEAATIVGSQSIADSAEEATEVTTFLDERSHTATRIWANSDDLLVATSLTKYPYDIFAAASLGSADELSNVRIVASGDEAGAADAVLYVGENERSSEIGTLSRHGPYIVYVIVLPPQGMPPAQAAAIAIEMTALAADALPNGETGPYHFPGAPSKLGGLALTAGLVTAAALASMGVARLRARRIRRRWSHDTNGATPGATTLPPPSAIGLDPDAKRLRRHGAMMTAGQLLCINIGIVALAGDFRWTGVIVAVLALAAGLLLTRWWQRRELGLLGDEAPPREFVLPRLPGAVLGIVSLAVLAAGVGFALKGIRYIVLKPSLAQLKWADLLGLAPRTVGYVFAIGGFLAAVLGGALFRLARAFGRQGTKRVLAADTRPAALYLRSFDDDRLPLPVIASARRPLFELFSLRGADPFEEAVAWELNAYGPVVAVGRPGRSLASLGAAREHLPDSTWQEQVAARMGDAGIIAVATGETDGLAWELGKIVDGGHLAKTFFVFPPVAPADLERRWQHTSQSLGRAGVAVGDLGVPLSVVHTVHVRPDGSVRTTFASRRDEATYRTAVDRTLTTRDARVPALGAPGGE